MSFRPQLKKSHPCEYNDTHPRRIGDNYILCQYFLLKEIMNYKLNCYNYLHYMNLKCYYLCNWRQRHMKKHAFLIIAHNNEVNLINLIKSIDFDCNDIYIHIDKK